MSTISICAECVKILGMNYSDEIGGTIFPEACQLCGKDKWLHEHRTSVLVAPEAAQRSQE